MKEGSGITVNDEKKQHELKMKRKEKGKKHRKKRRKVKRKQEVERNNSE